MNTLRREWGIVRAQPWVTFAVVCTALIGLGPRIPLDISVPGRIFDLRLTDLVIVAAMPAWAAGHFRGAVHVPLVREISIYLLISALATAVACATLGLSGARGLLYFAKEAEYFVLFIMVASTIRGRKQVEAVLTSVMVVAAVNLAWVIWQLAAQRDVTFLSTDAWIPADVLAAQGGTQSYGPQLVGELSPFSTGGLFSAAFLLSGAFVTRYSQSRIRMVAALVGALCFAAVVISQSRIWLASVLLTATAVVWVDRQRAKTLVWVGSLILAGSILSVPAMYRHASEEPPVPLPTASVAVPLPLPTASVAVPLPLPTTSVAVPLPQPLSVGVARRLSLDAVRDSVDTRLQIWKPLLDAALRRAFVGYGKGSIGAIPGLGAGEAHDYYLRTFVESGILGVVSFAAVLAAVLRIAWKGLRSVGNSATARWWCLTLSVAMIICAFLQDAFTPIIVAELYWLSAGLAIAESCSNNN